LAEEYEEVEEEGTIEEDIIPEEYIEIERKVKEISIIDFNEFIVKTELWYRFLEGALPIDELVKIMARRRAARIRIGKKLAEAKKKKTGKKTARKKTGKKTKKTSKKGRTKTGKSKKSSKKGSKKESVKRSK